MRADEIRKLYDADYAASYEAKFLDSRVNEPDTLHEIELLHGFLAAGARWLDVACGTGYFLHRFPEVDRTGIDISPEMLRRARAADPKIEFLEHDYRIAIPAFSGLFDLVSCMWYAYCLVDTIAEMELLIENLADWTAPAGICFVPLADPRLIARCNIPYRIDTRDGTGSGAAGEVVITGIIWNFIENDGQKVHAHMLSPNVEFMSATFERYFSDVAIVEYPMVRPGVGLRSALVASKKKPTHPR